MTQREIPSNCGSLHNSTLHNRCFPMQDCALSCSNEIPGSSLLPDQSRQPPPAAAQGPTAHLFIGLVVAKVENFCSTRFHPHWGHSGGSCWRVKTSFSKTCPQLEQAYSKIGMADRTHSLGVCVATQFACRSEESATLIGGRRGISHCLENTQSEIPRSARNDSLARVITQTP